MLPLLILLALPVLGGALLALDHHVRFNASRDELSWLSLLLRVTGLAMAGIGLLVMIVAAVGDQGAPGHQVFDVLLRIGAGGYGLLAILTAVIGNAFRGPRDVSTLREESRVDQRASLFRLLSWCVVLMPLAPFVPVVVLVVPLVLTTVLSTWGALNRGSQISLLWRLAIAAENGLPYADEAESASPGAGRMRREGLMALGDRLRNGQSLGEAIDDGSPLLPRGDILAIRATDGTPALPATLRLAAERSVRDLTDLREGGKHLPMQAYVVNVVLILVGIVAFLMFYIVPKHKMIFSDFEVELPEITRRVFSLSDDAGTYWFLVGPLLCVPLVLLLAPPVVALAGWENLNFPLLMRWFPRRDAPEVLRVLAAIVDSGRPLGAALAEIARRHPREDLRTRLDRIAAELESGDCSWEVLCRDGFLRRDEAAALDAAAANNHLAWALRALAEGIDSRQRTRTAWILEWQRPLLIGLLGVAVAVICVAMFLPLVTVIHHVEGLGR